MQLFSYLLFRIQSSEDLLMCKNNSKIVNDLAKTIEISPSHTSVNGYCSKLHVIKHTRLSVVFSVRCHNIWESIWNYMLGHLGTWLFDIVSVFSKLPTYVVFRPGNHGRPFTADLHPRWKSTVAPIRKTIGPMTYFASKCARRDPMHFIGTFYLCKEILQFMNDHVR